MYTIEDFSEELTKHLKLEMRDKEFTSVDMIKSNDIKKYGISIKSKDSPIVPVIHINEYYDNYINENCNMDMIVEHIKESLKEHMDVFNSNFKIKDKMDNYEDIKEYIYPVLLNTEGNEIFLKDIIKKPFLDLSIAYRIVIKEAMGISSCLISHKIIESWNISIETLEKDAFSNLENSESFTYSMLDIMLDAANFPEEIIEYIKETSPDNMKYSYVAMTDVPMYGSNILLKKEFLHKIANDFNENLYIIPSSVSEIILITESMYNKYNLTIEDVLTTINEVNNNEEILVKENVLSGSFYKYDIDKEELVIVEQRNI